MDDSVVVLEKGKRVSRFGRSRVLDEMMLVAVKMPHVFVREGGREEEGAILSNKLLLNHRSYTEITCTTVFSQAFADVNQRRDVSVILP